MNKFKIEKNLTVAAELDAKAGEKNVLFHFWS